jgi:hypothetical protein
MVINIYKYAIAAFRLQLQSKIVQGRIVMATKKAAKKAAKKPVKKDVKKKA